MNNTDKDSVTSKISSGSASSDNSSSLPEKKKTSLRMKLIALFFSFFLLAVILGIGELCCRWFGDINLQGNSTNLFTPNLFGTLRGNTPNTKGLSFDVETVTDENGFRIDPLYPDPTGGVPVLILGDSVTFGCGVEEGETFVGRMRKHAPNVRLYNASVIGYGAKDYEAFLRFFLPRHPEIRRVWLFVCLNDINTTSGKLQAKSGSVETLKSVGLIQSFNDYLRCRSQFYLWLRGAITDSAERYYLFDLLPFQADETPWEAAMKPLADLARQCKASGVQLDVFTLPYQAQLRSKDADSFWPQKRIVSYLESQGVTVQDLSPKFSDLPETPSRYFLYADPMHLNARGHKVLFEALQPKLETLAGKKKDS